MEFKKTQKVVLPYVDFTEEDIASLKLVNPVDFISEEAPEHISGAWAALLFPGTPGQLFLLFAIFII